MAAVAPQVMNKRAFKNATNPRSIFKRHRGRALSRIDHAVGRYRDGQGSAKVRIKNLLGIVSACRAWLAAKEGKMTDTATLRRTGVTLMAQQAFARMQYEIFEQRKATNMYTGSMQPLQGAYAYERSTYVKSGKTQAVSGSTASALVRNAASIGAAGDLNGKSFNQLSEQEFTRLVMEYAPEMAMETEVIFMKKQDRLGSLVVIEDGVLWSKPDRKMDTGSLESGHPYVIDAYGNLFSTDHNEKTRNLPLHQRFNHSSFNAGKDVICAGIVQVVDGNLWSIDNNSGHYKPDRYQVINALLMLKEGGVDLAKVRVGLKEPNTSPPGGLAFKYYNNATAFLANPNMPPHEQYVE